MQNKPLLSIATSIYNTGDKLLTFLESISNQTYKNIELIIIDDYSTDIKTINILKDLENGKIIFNKKFKIIRNKKNLGLVKSFQKALNNTNGDYVAFPEPDDYVDNDFYEIAMNDIILYNVDVVKGLLCYKYKNRQEHKSRNFNQEEKDNSKVLNMLIPVAIKNSHGDILSYVMPDITYCWFYVFSKNILSHNYKKPNFKNAIQYGFSNSLFIDNYKESIIPLYKASFYHYNAHEPFNGIGIYHKFNNEKSKVHLWDYEIIKEICKQYKKFINKK